MSAQHPGRHLGAEIIVPVERLKRHMAHTGEGAVTLCGIGDTPGPLIVTGDRDIVTCTRCLNLLGG